MGEAQIDHFGQFTRVSKFAFLGPYPKCSSGTISGFALANVTSTTALSKALDLQFGLYNALNQRYADPGSEEHLQRAIGQDGRTLRIRLLARF